MHRELIKENNMSGQKKIKKKKLVAEWLLTAVVIAGVFIGFNYIKAQKLRGQKMEAMEEQRQILIDNWQEQGLSDEEIKAKLESMRPNGLPEDRERGIGIMKVMTGGLKGAKRSL